MANRSVVRVAVLAAAAADIDAAIVGDAEHPGGGGRFAAIEQMRLAPDRLHHVLGHVGCGERSQPEPEHLGMHARPEMIEQHGERVVVAMGADRRQQFVQFVSLWPLDICGGAAARRYETRRSRPVPLRTGLARPSGREGRDGLTPTSCAADVASIGGGTGLGCVGGHTLPAAGRPRRLRLPNAFRNKPNWIKLERFAIHSIGVFARPDAHPPTMADCPAATYGGGIGRSRQCPAA